MKFADFIILAVVIIALIIALWYNHKGSKKCGGCCGNCSFCGNSCSDIQSKEKRKQ